jgi:hypothetical protein
VVLWVQVGHYCDNPSHTHTALLRPLPLTLTLLLPLSRPVTLPLQLQLPLPLPHPLTGPSTHSLEPQLQTARRVRPLSRSAFTDKLFCPVLSWTIVQCTRVLGTALLFAFRHATAPADIVCVMWCAAVWCEYSAVSVFGVHDTALYGAEAYAVITDGAMDYVELPWVAILLQCTVQHYTVLHCTTLCSTV